MSINLYNPQFDWLTATTKKHEVFAGMCAKILKAYHGIETKISKRIYGKPYEGIKLANGIFIGERLEGCSDFGCIVIFEGEIASCEIAQMIVCSHQWHKTRIDCQYTIRGDMSPVIVADMLRRTHVSRGKKPMITSIDTGGREGTVYVGSRKSDKYTRIYTKEVKGSQGADFVALRYEVEIKGKAVQQVIVNCQNKGMANAVKFEIFDHMSNWDLRGDDRDTLQLKGIRDTMHTDGLKVKSVTVKEEDKTIRWLYNQVIPAMERLANSHSPDIRKSLREAIDRMAETVDESEED